MYITDLTLSDKNRVLYMYFTVLLYIDVHYFDTYQVLLLNPQVTTLIIASSQSQHTLISYLKLNYVIFLIVRCTSTPQVPTIQSASYNHCTLNILRKITPVN